MKLRKIKLLNIAKLLSYHFALHMIGTKWRLFLRIQKATWKIPLQQEGTCLIK